MDTGHPFRPRQMRALVLLMVLLPFLPSAVTFRYIMETLRVERETLTEQVNQLYGTQLDRVLGGIKEIPEATPKARAAAIRKQLQHALGPGVSVEVRPSEENRQDLKGLRQGTSRDLSGLLPGWQVILKVDDANALGAELSSQAALIYTIASFLSLLVLAISGMAGWAITHELHRSELRLTSLAAVGHELKTPLAASSMLLETLQHRSGNDLNIMTQEYLPLLEKENRRLIGIVDNFLTAARLQMPDTKIHPVPLPLKPLVDEALEWMRTPLESNRFHLECHVPHELPAVLADRATLVNAFVNLIDNAIKYSEQDRFLSIKAALAPQRKNAILVEFEDHGIGMSPEDLRLVFQPFVQGDARLSRRREGCGLGLSIVRNVVQRHGGKVSVHSEPGKGTRFTVLLPCVHKKRQY